MPPFLHWVEVSGVGWRGKLIPCTPSPSGQLDSKSDLPDMPVPRITRPTSMGRELEEQ